ncbi:hypothetical protein [Sphaerospermopsis sp. FACHB-1194]|uniref:hypothetical protein n=1 Tax=Sphaerospermopsis sp. FACHB-1194 TaxID=2692862 RepID=UPI0016816850|nr:hypothetical protein [Sphaerospermopsis sp. FACHB-1194]MBD2148349.1 hypothetical protein [Sphaerospermopsis sp. FACHB-1194]
MLRPYFARTGVRSQGLEYLCAAGIQMSKFVYQFVHQLSSMTRKLSFILNPVFCLLNPYQSN